MMYCRISWVKIKSRRLPRKTERSLQTTDLLWAERKKKLANFRVKWSLGNHQEEGNPSITEFKRQYWWDTDLPDSIISCQAWKYWKERENSNYQNDQIFQFEHLINKKGTQSTMTSYSYNWPQFLIRRRFTYPDDLPMTSNSLCEAVSNMFPTSWSEQYWSDQKGGNPMLQIKYKGILPQWTSSASVWPQFLIRSRFTYPNDLKQPLRGWY